MTVLENLEMGAYVSSDLSQMQSGLENALKLFPQLEELLHRRSGTLSGGEQQMLALGRAMMLRPKLLLADEPSLGLSPNYVEALFEKLIEIRESGVSILLVEQNARMALETADRGYVFEIGGIRLEGNADDLAGRQDVQKAYFGE
jgi:branched-chain amino acid transport system ATP-binding protein